MCTSSNLIRQLLRSQRGAIAPLFLLSAMAILATSLGGIDLIRYSVAQGRLQYALDGATLSAGRNLANLSSTPTIAEVGIWQDDAYAYFRSNMPSGYIGSTIVPEDLEINYEDDIASGYTVGQYINMQAKGDLPLLSTGFLKIASMPLLAANQALRRTRSDLEVVMALDNTGSMDAENRMGIMKTAATELTDTVLGASLASGVEGRAFIGLVPFAEVVNVGNEDYTRRWMQAWATGQSDRQDFINNRWKGCITEPYWAPNRASKLPAAAWTPTSAFQPLTIVPQTAITRSDLSLRASSGGWWNPGTYDFPLASTIQTPQPRSLNGAAPIKGVSTPQNTSSTDSRTTIFNMYSWANPDRCVASRQVQFLSDEETTIKTAINAMYSDGGTIIPTGLLWAWRMLDPNWRGNPGWGDADKPRDPEPKILSKVIVLLTDGDNDATNPVTYSGYSAKPHADDTRLPAFTLKYGIKTCSNSAGTQNCTTSEKTSSISRNKSVNTGTNVYQNPINSLRVRHPDDTSTNIYSGMTTIGYSRNEIDRTAMDGYLSDLCTAVKTDGNGIKIYTVALGRDVDQNTNALMSGCSSGASYAYTASNVNELPIVFRAIAGALTELRLTQ